MHEAGHTIMAFNYSEMFKVDNEEMHDVWNLPAVQIHEIGFRVLINEISFYCLLSL